MYSPPSGVAKTLAVLLSAANALWAAAAVGVVVIAGCSIFGGAQSPATFALPATTTTTTVLQHLGGIVAGQGDAGDSINRWMLALCGLAVPAGVFFWRVLPGSAVGASMALAGAVGVVWNLALLKHGELIAWVAVAAILAGAVAMTIITLRKWRAMAEAPMHALEDHKATLASMPANAADPTGPTLWDRLTEAVGAQYARAGVADNANAVLERLGYREKPKG